ncbi:MULTISPECIES: hypothetical protein [Clostridium]|jgi:hypothetical protein|uniref:Uncharacterized protein n=1 Tax=Clostridium saccharoperbutylacetonicum N1-4(HMT) TaxID=931276 RepID=M1MGJ9_9CLOT|nr:MULTISPECIES: hypothetical protein [Clostridium]AGF54091.1 hypothetical protein Cspa_c02730 [Clostridium saccharoperbutylacetonicum N1-4(HMT)]AQR92995.1 hypothetical protein CLSAP_02700 [Clostridium saccharoperbutylacetonicum]NRT59396.1 hypothetical protein [Clostridium saccharoperbutylacetonicum]NSB28587.1 hypothetical protein [Clostridium saccharoperbutylacetonicum]NSB34406.1 hypothetical protein [Clostridium saccharoperbutylacetonicum]
MDKEPYNEYLVVMPSGNCKGFNDIEGAKAYINIYYEWKYDDVIHKDGFVDATEIGGDQPRFIVFTQLGAEEGAKCEIYKTEAFINAINKELVFEDEKEEIISKLCEAKVEFNIYDYSLDTVLADIQEVEYMEDFGDYISRM